MWIGCRFYNIKSWFKDCKKDITENKPHLLDDFLIFEKQYKSLVQKMVRDFPATKTINEVK